MKKVLRMGIVALAVACSTAAFSMSALASSTAEQSSAEQSSGHSSHSSSVSVEAQGDVSGSYRDSYDRMAANLNPYAFMPGVVYVDPVTHAVSNVYDAAGNLIPATLSSDGHYYIVPTNEGYLYIATGM